MSGYKGKVIFIDLTQGRIVKEELPESIYKGFLGGAGLGARMIYERMRPGVDPLGPENILGFVPGLLTGTPMPMTNKSVFMAKSPLTDTWGDANAGGFFGPELKNAGYDALFFKGKAAQPVYLVIKDNDIQVKEAGHLWGKDTVETIKLLTEEAGEERIGIACIGPAGERRSLISSIVTDHVRVAGRSGIGAVMGSKMLKGVVVKGSSKREMKDQERFSKLRKETLKHLRDLDNLPFMKNLSKGGTSGGPLGLVPGGASPIKNWQLGGKEAFPDYEKTGGPSILKYLVKKDSCGNCPIVCGGFVEIKEGPYAMAGRRPEYETLAAFGSMLLNSDGESIIKASDMCDRLGLDTISTGSVLAFAMECYERNVIGKKETEGIDLAWGNSPAIIAMLEKIGKREGLGEILADGVKRASERLGKGSENWAIHIHGQEPAMHDPRLYEFRGLGYITGGAPGRHMIAHGPMRLQQEGKLGPYPEIQEPKGGSEIDRMGRINALGGSYSQAFADCGMCLFALTDGSSIRLADLVSALTGWEFGAADLIKAGERTLTLCQSFNIREGLRASDFKFPERIGLPPPSGPLQGRTFDFDAIRRSYFRAMDWNPDTGVPSSDCLRELGLEELVKQE